MIPFSIEVIAPARLYFCYVEKAVSGMAHIGKKIARPAAQRPSQPEGYRDVEALLRPVYQPLRNVAAQQLAKEPFALSVADHCIRRHPPGEFDDAVVKKWASALKTVGHAGPVKFYQDVAGQIVSHIVVQKPRQQVIKLRRAPK
jgi:hypothetical protein